MFRKTSPQTSMFESQYLVPPEKAARLAKSWAEPFRTRVLPLIDEEVFRDAFSQDNGRPNTSIRLLVGLHLLRDWHDMTDAEVVEQLDYNLQWQYALGVEPARAHVSEKTLWTFRQRLKENERAQRMFEAVTRGLAEADGLRLGRQRLDSTHVVPNIAILTRLGLFVETTTAFLKELRRMLPDAFATVPAGFVRRYLEREGYFSDAKRSQAQRRLDVVAQDVLALVRRFSDHPTVSVLPSFVTLCRMFDEQCEVIDDGDEDGRAPGAGDGDDAGEGGPVDARPRDGCEQAKLREPRSIGGDSLQSPHDPDATYGHKGKGYEVQVAETFDPGNPYQLITAVAVNGANDSDQAAVSPMLDQLEAAGMMPMELLADTGYGSGANIVQSAERGVELMAPVQDPHAPAKADPFEVPVADEQTTPNKPADVPAAESDCPVDLGDFAFDSTCQQVICCPAGHEPAAQRTAGGKTIATFAAANCAGCPLADLCPTRQLANGDRQLNRGPASIATELRQVEQQQAPFKERYRARSGIESTNAELKHQHGLGRLRIRGRPQVTLAATLKAMALNVKRAMQYHVRQLVEPAEPELAACVPA